MWIQLLLTCVAVASMGVQSHDVNTTVEKLEDIEKDLKVIKETLGNCQNDPGT